MQHKHFMYFKGLADKGMIYSEIEKQAARDKVYNEEFNRPYTQKDISSIMIKGGERRRKKFTRKGGRRSPSIQLPLEVPKETTKLSVGELSELLTVPGITERMRTKILRRFGIDLE